MKLKEIRKQKQFTQEQIAKILNVTREQISKLETGVSLANEKQIVLLCKALNCTADYLLGLIDTNKEEE